MPDRPDITIPVQGGAPAATEPGPPNGDRYLCIISTCPWYFDMPPAPIVDVAVLAHIFGPGVMTLQAQAQRQERIERALEAHFNTHTVLEFATEIHQLKGLCIGLTSQLGEMGQAYEAASAAKNRIIEG